MIRCDNGPELVAYALRDWCRFNSTNAGYIEPGAPWQNPYIESFNGHLRRELLDLEAHPKSSSRGGLVETQRGERRCEAV